MNNFIGCVFAKGERSENLDPGKRIHAGYGDVNDQFRDDTAVGETIRSVSLPWEILEAAYFFFRKKGFEKTTILAICRRIGIKETEFYNHFQSLDEVLEILWAR